MWHDLQRSWFLDVNRFAAATPVLHAPFRLFAVYGVALFAVLLLLGWWVARRDRDLRSVAAALWAPIGVLVAVGVNQPVANLVREARPYTVLPHAVVLVARSQDYSFPSDHAVMAGAVAAGLLLVNRRLGLVAVLLAMLMAFARVYVGAHFPLDVVAGLLLGAAVTVLGYLATRRLTLAAVHRLARTPVRPLLTTAPGRAVAPATPGSTG